MTSNQDRRRRGRVLSWVGGAILLLGGLFACSGGMQEIGCGDRDTGYDQCRATANGDRTAGAVTIVAGLGIVLYGAIEMRRK